MNTVGISRLVVSRVSLFEFCWREQPQRLDPTDSARRIIFSSYPFPLSPGIDSAFNPSIIWIGVRRLFISSKSQDHFVSVSLCLYSPHLLCGTRSGRLHLRVRRRHKWVPYRLASQAQLLGNYHLARQISNSGLRDINHHDRNPSLASRGTLTRPDLLFL